MNAQSEIAHTITKKSLNKKKKTPNKTNYQHIVILVDLVINSFLINSFLNNEFPVHMQLILSYFYMDDFGWVMN